MKHAKNIFSVAMLFVVITMTLAFTSIKNGKVIMIVSLEVKNFTEWKKGFDAGAPVREKAGIKVLNICSSIENENKIVTDLNMSYFHIPVNFENPTLSDLKLFLNILQALGANKVWIHCAKNYRVSAFMYVYHKYILHTPFEQIDLSIFDKWQPSLVWQELMKVSLEDLYKA